MNNYKLIRINPYSAFKVGLGIGAVVGAVAAVIYIIGAFVGGLLLKGFFGGIGGGIVGVFAGIFFGVLYALGIGVAGWLYAMIYNIVTKYTGPLEVQLYSK